MGLLLSDQNDLTKGFVELLSESNCRSYLCLA